MSLFMPDIIKPKPWKGEPYKYVQEKIDGWRVTLYGQRDTTIAMGRTSLLDAPCLKIKLPYQSMVDGELYVPGAPASQVTSALANDPGRLAFKAFAVPYWEGEDERFELVPNYRDLDGLPPLHGAEDLLATTKHEGVVVKLFNYAYWYKIKKEATADLVCVGTELAGHDTKFTGQIGSLVLADATGRVVANAKVINDEFRAACMDESPVGKIFEVQYQYVGAGGKLRHPRILRERKDKNELDSIA